MNRYGLSAAAGTGLATVSGQGAVTGASRQAARLETPVPDRSTTLPPCPLATPSVPNGENMSTLPAGYRPDTHGRLVPVERIRPIDLARDELVTELVAEARELSLRLQRFKARAFADVAASIAVHLGIPAQGPGRSFL